MASSGAKKNKKQFTAFGEYLREHRADFKGQGRTDQEMVKALKPRFDALPEAEKKLLELKAKKHKEKYQEENRQDNQRQHYMAAANPYEKKQQKFDYEIKKFISRRFISKEDIAQIKFYLIDFQILCHMDEFPYYDQKGHVPVEVGLIEMSLKDGITKQYHKLIRPYDKLSDIPSGVKGPAFEHSQNTHKIPVPNENGTTNFFGVWNELVNFINPNGLLDEYPPVFTIATNEFVDHQSVEDCIDFLSTKAKIYLKCAKVNHLKKVYELARIFRELMAFENTENTVPLQSCIKRLLSCKYIHKGQASCEFHSECDQQVLYCALGSVKRWAYAMFDTLCGKYNCAITKNHQPPETTIAGTAKVLRNGFDDEPTGIFPEKSRRGPSVIESQVATEGFGSDLALRRKREDELRARQARGTPLSEAVKIGQSRMTQTVTRESAQVTRKMNNMTLRSGEARYVPSERPSVNYWHTSNLNPSQASQTSQTTHSKSHVSDILELPEANPIQRQNDSSGFIGGQAFKMSEEDFPSLR